MVANLSMQPAKDNEVHVLKDKAILATCDNKIDCITIVLEMKTIITFLFCLQALD